MDPLSVVRSLADEPGVLVGFSGGKDSVVTLDLCVRFCRRVVPFFMYYVPGLSYQDRYLDHVASRYRLDILRVPHWHLSTLFRRGTFRFPNAYSQCLPRVRINDIEAALRAQTHLRWVCTGQKCDDSLQRRGMISSCRGRNLKTLRAYPVGYWSDAQIWGYIRERDLFLPSDYAVNGGRSIGSALRSGRDLALIHQRYPSDYAKIIEWFPFLAARAIRDVRPR